MEEEALAEELTPPGSLCDHGDFLSLLWNHMTLHMDLPSIALLMLGLQDAFKICSGAEAWPAGTLDAREL